MPKDMKLIMEIWRQETLKEFAPGKFTGGQKASASGAPYSESWIEEVSVGEFLNFMDVREDEIFHSTASKLQIFFDRSNIFGDDDPAEQNWLQKIGKIVQKWAASAVRGGIGYWVGKLIALLGKDPVAMKVLVGVVILQVLTEKIEGKVAESIESKLGFHPDDIDYTPKEVEMVFGVDDSVLKLMRGGDNDAVTKISKDIIYHLKNQLQRISKALAENLKQQDIEITDFEKETFLSGNYGYDYYKKLGDEDEQQRKKELATFSDKDGTELKNVLEDYYQFLNSPLNKIVTIEKTMNTQALEKISQKIGNEKAITIPAVNESKQRRRIVYRGKK